VILAQLPLLRFGLRRDDVGALEAEVIEHAVPAETDAPVLFFDVAVGCDAEHELASHHAAEPRDDARVRASGRLVVDIGVRRVQRGDQLARARMKEAQPGNAGLSIVGCNRRDPVEVFPRPEAFVAHDDRHLEPEVAPRAREQHVLHGLAADVATVLVREHRVRVETDDAYLADAHTVFRPDPPDQPYGSRASAGLGARGRRRPSRPTWSGITGAGTGTGIC
jgi:hypothetical protein